MWRASLSALALVVVSPSGVWAETGRVPLADAREALAAGDRDRASDEAGGAENGLDGAEKGRALLRAGRGLIREGRLDEAEEALEDAAELLPHLADRIELARADALATLGRPEEAASAYAAARRAAAIDAVAMHADLGQVEARLAAGERSAPIKALQVLRRYPGMPEAREVELHVAEHYERRGQAAAAAQRYRALWLEHPTSRAAAPARERLEALAAQGVRVPRIKGTERLARAQALLAARELDEAEEELAAVVAAEKGQTRGLALRELALVAYRRGEIPRARKLLAELAEARGPVGPLPEWCEIRSGDPSGAIRRLTRGKGVSRRSPPGQLAAVAQLYLDAGMYAEALEALSWLGPRRGAGFFGQWVPWARLKLGQYDEAIPGLARMQEERWSVGRRDYWVGRAHHLAGRPCDARASYEAVIAADSHGYYALWARQRLGELRDAVRAAIEGGAEPPRCPAPAPPADEASAAPAVGEAGAEATPATVAWTDPDPLAGWSLGPRTRRPPADEAMEAAFSSLIDRHGEALPWLERARDLWAAGDPIAAGEELRQARAACRGWASEQAGLPTLWGGRPSVRRPHGPRAVLTADDWDALLLLASGVGETGLEMRIRRPAWSDVEGWHPLAYEPIVREVAEGHGIPAELVWSIMRVESYFNRYAVSHAHAVGLMQILPRTGRRVAHLSGRDDYALADLMEPEASLDLSAWYLRALLDRFHGAVPLAVASYNGGPHNVAHWILRRADGDRPLPMDEFLEEIPFTETFRYVRRVLGSMAVYHAYAGLPPPRLPGTVERDVVEGVNF